MLIVVNSIDKFSKLFDNAKIKIYQQSKTYDYIKTQQVKIFLSCSKEINK